MITFCDACAEVKLVEQYGDNWHCSDCKTETLETIKVGGRTFCAGCYAKASEQAGGDEEIGQLAYDFLHYEWEHLTKEQQDALVKGAN
jgi:hypothetical protein